MTEDRWRRLEALFTAALGLEGDTREAFIARETVRDPNLESELRQMLNHTDGAGDRIAAAIGRVAGSAAAVSTQGDWVGRRFGPYRILREVGRGGMGAGD